MRTSPPAGKPAAPPMLLNVPRLMTTYYRGAGVKLEVDPLVVLAYTTGCITDAHKLPLTVVKRVGRSDVPLYDPRLEWKDPHGWLVVLHHAVAG
jgi:hypothetical protein